MLMTRITMKLTNLKYDDNGTEREMAVPKGDVLHQFRQDVKSGQAANCIMGYSS